ncbi:DNA-primase RepB domain-containing protein [Parvularcula marina]|uniref:RepB-like DNA primase domain-containing protein n=1 Tax=Parvularcula marina TaxID=2292771 RepID=A0A371R7J0_9PROT|nr:DNA-primase RepB domain-containing protein [Parvularcula marina]RFB01415.1 hypothetical protein DX908_14075 [Parvularcula marina]
MAKQTRRQKPQPHWLKRIKPFLEMVYEGQPGGHVFLAAMARSTGRWAERCFETNDYEGMISFIRDHPRTKFDLYFCPHVFAQTQRKRQFALSTCYLHVDIDDADPNQFEIFPSQLIETSPGRYQGLWLLNELIPVEEAEARSKALAYCSGSGRNGWSITKMMRIPYTYNHKPQYDRPFVRLAYDLPIFFSTDDFPTAIVSNAQVSTRKLNPSVTTRKDVLRKYRTKLSDKVRYLLRRTDVHAVDGDRSGVIYAIVASLHHAGASPDEIASAVWEQPHFIQKHGKNETKLVSEVSRILKKLES